MCARTEARRQRAMEVLGAAEERNALPGLTGTAGLLPASFLRFLGWIRFDWA